MAKLEFKDLTFEDKNDKIRITFLKMFYFELDKTSLKRIADFKIEKNSVIFEDINERKAQNKFGVLLEKGFKGLKNKINNKKAIYIHKNSGIPLIGHVAFGIIDRGTNLIEVKPITSCNLRCIYCSVDENKRPVDFVIEEDYLVEEFKKLVEFKENQDIEAHIASQGEPLLYSPIVDLIADIKRLKQVKKISIDTNGTMLTKELVDKLIDAGLTQFNLSINSLDKELSKKIADAPYDIIKIKDIAGYISKKAGLMITPVLLPTINDKEMEELIKFAKSINARIGIQNFLNYRFGKNPVKQIGWEEFYQMLKKWEEVYKIKLIFDETDFSIEKTKELEKPFKKGEIIKVEVIAPGRLSNEKIAIAKERIITIPNCHKEGKVKIKITRTKPACRK
ncbi:MAG: radical SAM protein, partial [Nanoarchaeota archaeon]